MELPFIKMCNYALDHLSRLDIPGLPPFREDHQIVFACPARNCTETPSHDYNIVMVTWDELKKERSKDQSIPYSESYESDICARRAGPNFLSADALLTVEMWKRTNKYPGLPSMTCANKRLSSYDTTYAMNLLLTGPFFDVMWCDRQGFIESQWMHLRDNFPHFLLLLLILQRLYDTRSGSFNNSLESGFYARGDSVTVALRDEDTKRIHNFTFYPKHDRITRPDRKSTGRGTFAFGGREATMPSELLPDDKKTIQKGNDCVLKICWPKDSWADEAVVLKRAQHYGRDINLIENHIPDMLCHLVPSWICSSTKTIREFLGLPTEGARSLRIMVLRRLVPIPALKEKDMLTAYLQCFFCHFCLWKKGIRHHNISTRNLMWDPRRKVGVLSGFGSTRFVDQKDTGGRSARGAMPFLALELLAQEDECKLLRLYRHDAESFAWCLFYLCFAIVEDDGEHYFKNPNPLAEWFTGRQDCRRAKRIAWGGRDFSEYSDPNLAFPNTKVLVCRLDEYWNDLLDWKIHDRSQRRREERGMKTDSLFECLPYEELDDESAFAKLVEIHEEVLGSNEALYEVRERVAGMRREYEEVDWTD